MGNIASCAPIIYSNSLVKVLFNDGKSGFYTSPITVAELMLENPGKFVCDSCYLKVGHRIPGLSADENLQHGKLYYILPMEMLYSVLTNEEMNCLHEKASRINGGSFKFSRIFPVFISEFCSFSNAEEKRLETENLSDDQEECKRFSKQRSWKPSLETIIETSPHV